MYFAPRMVSQALTAGCYMPSSILNEGVLNKLPWVAGIPAAIEFRDKWHLDGGLVGYVTTHLLCSMQGRCGSPRPHRAQQPLCAPLTSRVLPLQIKRTANDGGVGGHRECISVPHHPTQLGTARGRSLPSLPPPRRPRFPSVLESRACWPVVPHPQTRPQCHDQITLQRRCST